MDCRMFVSYGTWDFNSRVYRALISASEKDIFLENRSHYNGWGMALFSEGMEIYLRSSRPIYHDLLGAEFLRMGKSYALFHARLASTGEPTVGADDSHPYRIQGDETIYIAHNGHVKKEIVGKEFNIEYGNKTDTEVIAFLLSRLEGNARERIKKLIDILHEINANETLNLFFLVNSRIKRTFYYYSEFNAREKYLTLFKWRENGNIAVMSSTIAYYLGLIDQELNILSEKVEKVEKGKLMGEDSP